MGDNSLSTQVTGTTIQVDDPNQFKEALIGNLIPRNTNGIAESETGSIGQSNFEWLKAFIKSGYFSAGDIKAHHSYNGTVPIDEGWFPCDGSIINETNYDAIRGAGAWDKYIIDSPLDGKYSPNLINKYLIGISSTTQDGSASINSVGNSGHTIDIQHGHSHSHTAGTHNHKWHENTGVSEYSTYSFDLHYSDTNHDDRKNLFDVNGNALSMQSVGGNILDVSAYTDNETISTNTDNTQALSTSQNIQPSSIEVIYYIRII